MRSQKKKKKNWPKFPTRKRRKLPSNQKARQGEGQPELKEVENSNKLRAKGRCVCPTSISGMRQFSHKGHTHAKIPVQASGHSVDFSPSQTVPVFLRTSVDPLLPPPRPFCPSFDCNQWPQRTVNSRHRSKRGFLIRATSYTTFWSTNL